MLGINISVFEDACITTTFEETPAFLNDQNRIDRDYKTKMSRKTTVGDSHHSKLNWLSICINLGAAKYDVDDSENSLYAVVRRYCHGLCTLRNQPCYIGLL